MNDQNGETSPNDEATHDREKEVQEGNHESGHDNTFFDGPVGSIGIEHANAGTQREEDLVVAILVE